MDPFLRKLVELQLQFEAEQELFHGLFEKQRAFIEDPSKFKAALCSRRAGKTYACAYYLISTALKHPGSRCIYIALTRKNAKDIIWRTLSKINDQFQLGFQKHETDLKMFKQDGTEISLVGANAENLAENFRGLAVPLVVIDEAASFRQHLNYLIDEVITPTLIDYDGTVALIGTPSASCFGAFFDATAKESMYSVHRWTVLNNPHIPHASKWLENYKKQKAWSDDNPIYLREWCGQWIKSEDSLVFKLRDHNIVLECGLSNPQYILGIDLGYEDSNAIVVLAFDYGSRDVYVLDEFKRSGQTISEFAEVLKTFIDRYDPIHIVADTGGLGKAIVSELNQRWGFQVKPAEKAHKYSNIELLNADLIDGKIKLVKGMTPKLQLEMQALQWDPEIRKIDERTEDHLCDALQYGFNASKHYTFRPEPKIEVTPERIAEEILEKIEAKVNEESNKSWWDDI